MKKFLVITLSVLAIFGVLGAIDAIAAPYYPAQGGTGTGTIPQAGQILIGNGSSTYTPAYLLCSGNCSVATASGSVTISVPPQASSTIQILPVSMATSSFSIVGDGSYITVTNPATSTIKIALSTAQVLQLLSASSPLAYNSSTGQFTCASCLTSLNGALLVANNLSDVASPTAARNNLGLGSISTFSKTDYLTSSTVYVSSVNGLSGAVTITSSSLGISPISINGNQAVNFFIVPGAGLTSTVSGATTTLTLVNTGDWAGTWQGTNSTTYYLASNPSGFTTTTIQAVLNSISGTSPISYNSSTGVISWTNSNNYITLASLSASSPLSYNSSTGQFSCPSCITLYPTINGTQSSTFSLVGDGTTITSTVAGATTTFSIINPGWITTSTFNATGTGNDAVFWNSAGNGLTSASSIYENPSTGNVAVSGTAPLAQFDVEGNVLFESNVTGKPATSTATITAGATSLSINPTTTTYPYSGYLVLGTEYASYASSTSSSFNGLTRGILGSTAASHNTGTFAQPITGLWAINSSTMPNIIIYQSTAGASQLALGSSNTVIVNGYTTALGGSVDITGTGGSSGLFFSGILGAYRGSNAVLNINNQSGSTTSVQIFGTNNGATTTGLYVDAGGNVGIGTNTVPGLLNLNDQGTASTSGIIFNGAGDTANLYRNAANNLKSDATWNIATIYHTTINDFNSGNNSNITFGGTNKTITLNASGTAQLIIASSGPQLPRVAANSYLATDANLNIVATGTPAAVIPAATSSFSFVIEFPTATENDAIWIANAAATIKSCYAVNKSNLDSVTMGIGVSSTRASATTTLVQIATSTVTATTTPVQLTILSSTIPATWPLIFWTTAASSTQLTLTCNVTM